MRLTRLTGVALNKYTPPASVIFDNANSAAGTSIANLTTSAWTIAGSNRVLVAGMGWSAGGTPPTYSAIKWEGSGGAALTQHGSTHSIGGTRRAIAYKIAPNAASGTLYGELSGTTDEMALGGVSVTNADQTAPLGTAVTAGTTNAGSPVTAAASNVTGNSNDMGIDFVYASLVSGGTLTAAVGEGGTMRWERESIGAFTCGTQSTKLGGASIVHSEILTGSSNVDWGIIAAQILSSG